MNAMVEMKIKCAGGSTVSEIPAQHSHRSLSLRSLAITPQQLLNTHSIYTSLHILILCVSCASISEAVLSSTHAALLSIACCASDVSGLAGVSVFQVRHETKRQHRRV